MSALERRLRVTPGRPETVRTITRELKPLRKLRTRIRALCREQKELAELEAMAREEGETALLADLARSARLLESAIATERDALRFDGPRDGADAYLEVKPGAGGLEAQDFARQLVEMYERFCARRSLAVRRLSERINAHGGVRRAVLEIKGRYAYG